ncbi:MAG: 30S ribosomal protein S6 [Myxococcales bacterium]|nr:30S ribosomal protein S6 [Myxococcales bacterium]
MAEKQAPARLREYETVFLVKPDLTDDQVDRIKDKVRGVVSREGGKLIRFTVWGKKRTMYPIAKHPRAIYVHGHYLGSSALVAEVERNLRNIDDVTRYLSVKLAHEVDPESRPVLEDLRMAGDVDEKAPPGERAAERAVEDREESVTEIDEEPAEEA